MDFYRVFLQVVFLFFMMASYVFAAFPAAAQQPAATAPAFNGQIVVAPASQPLPQPARLANTGPAGAPAVLTYRGEVSVVASSQPARPRAELGTTAPDGYRIVTNAGAQATLTFPDASQIRIREMSVLKLNGFARNSRTNTRGMLISLYAGCVRVLLSQTYQARESFFEIRTPNALVSLHFSQPDVEVIYAPSPLENMTALLEEGEMLVEEEAVLWQDVLAERQADVTRRQRQQVAMAQTAALQGEEPAARPVGLARSDLQEALAQIGLTQSEEDALLQAHFLQRDEALSDSYTQMADASASGVPLPDTRRADGLITGEDDVGKGTTFVFAYTVSISFMNRITREIRTIQHGQRAVVRGRGITMTVMNGNPMQHAPPRNIGAIFEFDGLGQMPSLDRPDESSIQSQPAASSSTQFPGSAGRPEAGGRRPRPHNIQIIIDEETEP